jgi:hypothetical protein
MHEAMGQHFNDFRILKMTKHQMRMTGDVAIHQ